MRCICEICDCGRHKCPHFTHLTKPTKDCTVTEYNEKFVPREMSRPAPFKPVQQTVTGKGRFADETTHKHDFPGYPTQEKFVHKHAEYVPNQNEFDGTTMYNQTFTYKTTERMQPIIRQAQKQQMARFEGEPTYKSDYRKWDMEGGRREYVVPIQSIKRSSAQFEGMPTYKSDYLGPVAPPPASFKPVRQYEAPTGKFADETDYRKSYITHSINREKPIKPTSEWHMPGVPLESSTTHHADFTPKQIDMVSSCKPPNKPVNVAGAPPISSFTTHRNDFKPWQQMERVVPINRAGEYSAPTGEFQGDTTYVRDFVPYDAGMGKMQPIKHKDNQKASNVPFQGTSSYSTDFKRWPHEQTKPIVRAAAYRPNDAPFEGESTFKSHYQAHHAEMAKPFKPQPRDMSSNAPFNGDTSYRTEFTPKATIKCPASLLESGHSGYVFQAQDPDTGHKFYVSSMDQSQRNCLQMQQMALA